VGAKSVIYITIKDKKELVSIAELMTRPAMCNWTELLFSCVKLRFAAILKQLKAEGTTVLLVSHDVEFCARCADRCALLFDGAVIAENAPRTFFPGNSFYTTAGSRMARHLLPEAVTAEDIVAACGGSLPITGDSGGEELFDSAREGERQDAEPVISNSSADFPSDRPDSRLRTWTLRGLAGLIPVTLWAGVHGLGGRAYYFWSALILLEALLAFGLTFENQKPKARKLVVIALLCALAVAGRAAFFWLPHFKPAVALIIVAGTAFGGGTGFLVGAMTAFISNFYFGQGPWTPWQMAACGLVGYTAGVLFYRRPDWQKRLSLSIFGVLAVLVIYGGIMNAASVLISQPRPRAAMFAAAFVTGFPLDLIHGAATAFFLWLLALPLLEKLDRVRVKYGWNDAPRPRA
jgi:uncharacterized membrane protein